LIRKRAHRTSGRRERRAHPRHKTYSAADARLLIWLNAHQVGEPIFGRKWLKSLQ
jgi:hypothetical protein